VKAFSHKSSGIFSSLILLLKTAEGRSRVLGEPGLSYVDREELTAFSTNTGNFNLSQIKISACLRSGSSTNDQLWRNHNHIVDIFEPCSRA
jgi:hypothetical protein